MITYLVLNIVFLCAVGAIIGVRPRRLTKPGITGAAALLLLTFVFDSLLIYFDIVVYDPSKLLGIKIGLAPIEDYFYPVLALLIVPVLWKRFGRGND